MEYDVTPPWDSTYPQVVATIPTIEIIAFLQEVAPEPPINSQMAFG